ncbi:PEFG-CTERM sorting domain-containing protein [Nitrosopumilus sp.]|uniref:PEFG-CTERM sorting domain-containing protein n=1 Tax=Nitrosopumilus sp. TaxID=2024843 RepID=UPI00247C7CF2|nr:PEFG-CTERM sorting domain-containing protein [Nitrosopumilus sp.]MCV0431881.1 PEFG-CTERM sorting domain-containing protein [Nitrosopumilus sp.]
MLKISLFMILGVSMFSTAVFAEPTLELDVSSQEIKALDSIWISGKITEVSQFKPVKLKIIGPDGALVFAPQLAIKDNGEFKKLLNPPIPSFKEGTYLVTASHEDSEITASTQFTVTSQAIPRNPDAVIIKENPTIVKELPKTTSGITMSADAINGSDIITINGNTSYRGTDITLIVNSPAGNLVTIAQVTPGINGDFEIEIKVGGPLWKEDGMYTITANQGTASEHKQSIKVEIKEGVVVPEFGVITSLVLAISIILIIVVSAKSKLAILPKY